MGRRLVGVQQPERYRHVLGTCLRAEVETIDGACGSWVIWDLDDREIAAIEEHTGEGWFVSSPFVSMWQDSYATFDDALNALVRRIDATGGVQSHELFWQGEGLPRWVANEQRVGAALARLARAAVKANIVSSASDLFVGVEADNSFDAAALAHALELLNQEEESKN